MGFSIRQGHPCSHSDVVSDGVEVQGGKKALNFFYHHIVLFAGLANVVELMMRVCFLLLNIASDPDRLFGGALSFLSYNESLKRRSNMRRTQCQDAVK